MKFLLLSLLFSITASASGIIPGTSLGDIKALDPADVFPDREYSYLEVKSKFKPLIKYVLKIDGIKPKKCAYDDFSHISFQNKDKEIFHAVYSIEHHCDGGNSMGIVLDNNGKEVTRIFDGDFDS